MGVLGVDQSVLLLRTGNDITKQDILNDLQEYGSGGRYYYRGRSSSEFFGSTDVFSANNLFCLINGFDVNQHYYYPHREYYATTASKFALLFGMPYSFFLPFTSF